MNHFLYAVGYEKWPVKILPKTHSVRVLAFVKFFSKSYIHLKIIQTANFFVCLQAWNKIFITMTELNHPTGYVPLFFKTHSRLMILILYYHPNHMEGLIKWRLLSPTPRVAHSKDQEWGLRIYTNKFPGDADTAGHELCRSSRPFVFCLDYEVEHGRYLLGLCSITKAFLMFSVCQIFMAFSLCFKFLKLFPKTSRIRGGKELVE